MIQYEKDFLQIRFSFTFRGSVLPRASIIAIATTTLTLFWWLAINGFTYHVEDPILTIGGGAASHMSALVQSVLTFFLTYRASIAYGRYWEGATLLNQIRGEWLNAASSLFAFCTTKKDKTSDVETFQNLLVRLMSLLFALAIQRISARCDEEFDIIDIRGIDQASLIFLANRKEKLEVVLQWIQRLIVDNMASEVVAVPAPVISRVFQELSRGIVNVNNAEKLTLISFPFCYAQISTALLLVNSLCMIFLAPLITQRLPMLLLGAFVSTISLWSINYVASDLEQPFGYDENHLPIFELQGSMNSSLFVLLEQLAQQPPSFALVESYHGVQTAHWQNNGMHNELVTPGSYVRDRKTNELAFPFKFPSSPRRSLSGISSSRSSGGSNMSAHKSTENGTTQLPHSTGEDKVRGEAWQNHSTGVIPAGDSSASEVAPWHQHGSHATANLPLDRAELHGPISKMSGLGLSRGEANYLHETSQETAAACNAIFGNYSDANTTSSCFPQQCTEETSNTDPAIATSVAPSSRGDPCVRRTTMHV